jgi:hypothetical protein
MAELKTVFWKRAAQSMPAAYRERYMTYLVRAERFDLALDGLFEFFSRRKSTLHPRSA